MSVTDDSAGLARLYRVASKHSGYQVLAGAVAALIPGHDLAIRSRYERERLEYIGSKLDFRGRTVADIGGNTGFFSFELLARGARQVWYFDGNPVHHEFVSTASRLLGLDQALFASNEYVELENARIPELDCALLMNVLHHVGDDYGGTVDAGDGVKRHILAALAALAPRVRWLVLQLGFNWKGDPDRPIFEDGTKSSMIDFVQRRASGFSVHSIGVPVRRGDGAVAYEDLNEGNRARDDSLGEFLNRPLFILRSRIADAG